MKKLIYLSVIAVALSACGDAHKTGGATQDSSASHGYSGAASPSQTQSGTGTAAGTNGSSDTSKMNQKPQTDTTQSNR